MKKKDAEILEVKAEPVSEPLPSLISQEEFFMQASKTSHIATLGGFYSWLKREGVCSKLPLAKWQQMLSEFKERKV